MFLTIKYNSKQLVCSALSREIRMKLKISWILFLYIIGL